MTQEEKAKAYDEALEDMRVVYPNLRGDIKLTVEHAFPELKESEDERIRKTLIHIVKCACDKYGIKYKGDEITEEKLLAYLEKQKESDGVWTEEDNAKVKAMCEEGNLKPSEKEWLKKLKNRIVKKEQNPAEKQDYSGLNDLERAIHRGFLSAGVKNVPVAIIKETAQECLAQMKFAEWSEEDEEMFERFLGWLQGTMGEKTYSSWLKSLRERFSLEQKQEWSEKDIEIIDRICSNLEYLTKEAGCDSELKDKLEERIKWMMRLKSLRPQPHWKPSEDQMHYLFIAVVDAIKIHNASTYGYDGYFYLKSLYDDLYKIL